MSHRSLVALACASLFTGFVACSADAPRNGDGDERPGPSSTPDGSPDTSDDAGMKPRLDREKFDAEMKSAACDAIEPCCTAFGVGFDPKHCRDHALEDPGPGANYDAEAAAACVALTRDAAGKCGVTSPGVALDVCSKVFTPTLELGARCFEPGECKGGPTVDCIENKCVKRASSVRIVARGAPCEVPGGEFTDICDATLDVCDPDTSKCVAAPGVDQPCVGWQCRPELYCADDDVCRPRTAIGESCDLGRLQCVDGASCEGVFGATCLARADIGQPCGTARCKDFLLCEPESKTCVVSRLGAGGENCVYP